jgi:hypothetical protein
MICTELARVAKVGQKSLVPAFDEPNEPTNPCQMYFLSPHLSRFPNLIRPTTLPFSLTYVVRPTKWSKKICN